MKDRIASTVMLAALSAAAALAQESIHYGSIGGRVVDKSGAAIQAAAVTARHAGSGTLAVASTNSDGHFRFPFLRVGEYEIRIRHEGFAEALRQVTVSLGSTHELPVVLYIAASESSVTVIGDSDVLETTRTQVAGTVLQQEIRSLPLNGRNFLDLALLVPGVSPTNTASNQLFAETSAIPGQGISVGSQRNFSNSFIVDGLSANDDAAGLSGASFSLDAVEELAVVTSGGQAELGRALGGYINAVTKSGGNSLHGDLFGFFRNQRFNAANPLSRAKLPMTQSQYGASLGGPVVHDRTFYFANFEQRVLNQSGLVTISPGAVAAINARLVAVGYPGAQIATGLYPNPVHSTNFLAKLDHQLSRSNQFSVRYSLYDVQSSASRGAGALSAMSASAGLDDTDHNIAVSDIATLFSHTVNEARAQFNRSHLAALPTDPVGPAVSISGVASFGTLSGSPTGRVNDLYEFADSLSYRAGTHALRVGTDLLHNDVTITYPRSIRGSYTFSSLANFLTGTYNNSGFTQTLGNSVVVQTNPNIGFYAQDEWKIGSRFTLNVGVRYDLQFLKSIATDEDNVSPRAGFAWTPFASRRTVVRGNFGLFYDRVPLRALANALLSSGNTTVVTSASQLSVSLSPKQAGAPVFPNILANATLPAGVLVSFTTMNPHMQNAYSAQGGLEIQQQLGAQSSISVGYQHLRGLHLIVSVNQNGPTCVASGTNNGCRPNPGYANNSQYSPLADSHYDGLHVSFVQRPVKWGSYRASYTWSKSLDNVGEFFFSSPIDLFNIWRDYGRSDDDQRHRLVFDGAVHTPGSPAHTAWQRLSHGFELSGMLQYYSALPLNVTSGVTTVQGTAGRPLVNGAFIGRNTGKGNDFFSVSARLSRSFRLTERTNLELLAEAFNALNHRNNLTLNGVFGAGAYPTNPSPSFGQVTAVNDPRSLQLAMRLKF